MSITADFETLMRQATYTADYYLDKAIKNIDENLGEGYAAEHPDLIAAYMKTASIDYKTSVNNKILEECVSEITYVLREYFRKND